MRIMSDDIQIKNKILEGTKKIISEGGGNALSVKRIVKECKISNSTFYKYFSSKQALLNYLKDDTGEDNEELLSIREKIIAKVIEGFSNNSFDELDIDEIAKNAGINRSSVYRYFIQKEH